MPDLRVLGVDACRGGWVGLTDDGTGWFGPTIDALVAAAATDGPLACVAIDIPIGLPTSGPRRADVLARAAIGARRSSVFETPVRAALLAATHAEGSALNRAATGRGLSQQAYALRHKVLEVDAWLPDARVPVIEVHPELSFATAAGRPLEHPKKTWAGLQERLSILASHGIQVPAELGAAGATAAVDDVLDAAVACWTAGRHARGEAVPFPDPPERLPDGSRVAVWA